MNGEILFVDGASEAGPAGPPEALDLGGPRDGQSEVLYGQQPPASLFIIGEPGHYRRHVRCAEDGRPRYLWVER